MKTKTKIPSTNWRTVRLGDVAEVITGKTPPTKKKELFGDKYPFITPTDIDDSVRFCVANRFLSEQGKASQPKIVLPPYTVCYTCIASIGKICITDQPSFSNQQINSLIAKKDQSYYLFLFYMLKFQTHKIKSIAGGTTTGIINKTQFQNIDLTLPPLPEQKAIAGVLGAFDDKIELLRAQNKTLEQIGQTLFQEWFVKKTDKMIPATKVLNFERGVEVGSSNYFEKQKQGTVPFYRVADIKDINIANVSTFTHKDLLQGKTFSNNDILVSFDGTVGRVFVGGTGGYSSGMRKLTIKQEFRFYTKSFIYFWAKSSPVQEIINEHATGTTILHASKAIDFLTIQSSKDVIKKFDAVGSALFDKILLNTQQTQTLEKMRDTLLPKLMSGEVGVECGMV